MTVNDPTPVDPRNRGDAFLQDEIDRNRAGEWILVPKAALAFAFVAALIALHEVFFA